MAKGKKQIPRIVFGLIFLVAVFYLFFSFCGRSASRVSVDSGKRAVMGTFARVIVVASDLDTANECIDVAFEQITKIDELMSDYKSDSEISRINKDGFDKPIKVSKYTYNVIQRSIEFSKLTGGAFDITVGPLIDLQHSVPALTDNDYRQACSKTGYDKLILDKENMTVQLAAEGMKLDVGAIAKGYAVEKAMEIVKKNGATGAMVDIGGDICCFGSPLAGSEKWRIGLQDSKRVSDEISDGEILMVLAVNDNAVATSGDYRRFSMIDSQRYSHIIDTKTGRSCNELSSVTIICPSAADADALATAVSVMGVENGLVLIETLAETEAILISSSPEFKIFKSSGAGKYIE